MDPTPVQDRQRQSNAFARQRDTMIVWLLERHPSTAGMLVGLGLFGSKTRALRRLQRLVKKKQLRLAGTVMLKPDGRPEHVFCRNRWVSADTLLHEVQLSRLCFKIDANEIRRGPAEVDEFLRPDAELRINGQRYLLEFDHGTMNVPVIEQTRFPKYIACDDLVLWVCSTDSRREALLRRADVIRETALFTTLDQALEDPHGRIWIDVAGARAALPRGSTKG